ncbi:hypothetical protein HYV83_04460 [Candidatus Woesearchaeota archaeon]|nr:hypothetical protein [Candidatus Woesearchaeota archaeon]
MLELNLYQELDDPKQFMAATILGADKTDISDALRLIRQRDHVTVTGSKGGELVAVYCLPQFSFENRILTNVDFGYLAVYPKGKGIYAEMIRSVGPLFEEFALTSAADRLVHRVVSTREDLFSGLGYVKIGTQDGLVVCKRDYLPVSHNLTAEGTKILEELVNKML